jgi:hypothetical protein
MPTALKVGSGSIKSLKERAHSHGAFTNGRRDALDGATTDVAYAEDAWSTCFRHKRHRVVPLFKRSPIS